VALAAGQYAVIVRRRTAFEARYGTGISILGEYPADSFSNSSEGVTMVGRTGAIIQSFTYLDDWLPSTDGPGYSMVAAREHAAIPDLSAPSSWAISYQIHGNPGAPNGPIFSTEFEGWRQQNFTPAELADPLISGPNGGPELLPNLLRYALGLSPAQTVSAAQSITIDTTGAFDFTFPQLRRPLDVSYIPESSTDLTLWNADSTPVTTTPLSDQANAVTIRFPANSRRFIRLRVMITP
jgi:hypothetical protein